MGEYLNMELNSEYKRISASYAPKSKSTVRSLLAFLSGGTICFLGEWLAYLYKYLGMADEDAYLSVTLSFIAIASLATSLGFFDKIAARLGAGTLVPVTGFSNSVTSSAIDTSSEGYIGGVGTKIFTVAGPVILYSSLTGTLYGLVYFLAGFFL